MIFRCVKCKKRFKESWECLDHDNKTNHGSFTFVAEDGVRVK